VNNNFPKTGSEAGWNAAYCRLENYLSALHIQNKVHQNQVILRLLERAAEKHRQNPEMCPTTLAMDEIRAAMDRWFRVIRLPEERVSVMGFLAILANAVPEKWPAAFLAEEIPADCQRALQASEVRAVPELQVTSMVPQPFANPLLGGFSWPKPVDKLARYLAPLIMKETAMPAVIPTPTEPSQ
jgi:hypothetical protein